MVKMRSDGRRLARDVVRAAPGVVGTLGASQRRNGALRAVILAGGDFHHLFDCRLVAVGGNQFVLSGVELVGRDNQQVRQAWWCRLLEGEEAPALSRGQVLGGDPGAGSGDAQEAGDAPLRQQANVDHVIRRAARSEA
jgi:hypothetical protein